ncbi:hypothetical protein [Virgibacillus salexigens]|uniref:hypothetical protein n=1 Tax=Virgibacillus massiliensis TaxID=1462526 RepID=UPI001371AEC1|nr:hypothetical protein [Virgibacillus massiliensis]MYL42674.1 hypothetical protein [Virgibacillus massiliensis]
MRKLFVLLCYSGALLFLVSACGNTDEDASDSTNTAVGLGQRFIEELYSVDNSSFDYNGMTAESLIHAQNEFSSYFTEKEFEELANKRFFLMPLEAASNQIIPFPFKILNSKKLAVIQKKVIHLILIIPSR